MRGMVLLVATVLAAVGIGVGVEAALQPPLYGPAAGRFTAAFPAAPVATSQHGRHQLPARSYTGRGPAGRLEVTVSVVGGSGWTGYAPVASTGAVQVFTLTTTHGRRIPPRRLVLHQTRVAGQWVEVGATCPTKASCVAVLPWLARLVDGRLVTWSATATARSAPAARALVTSLRPVGGTIPSPG